MQQILTLSSTTLASILNSASPLATAAASANAESTLLLLTADISWWRCDQDQHPLLPSTTMPFSLKARIADQVTTGI